MAAGIVTPPSIVQPTLGSKATTRTTGNSSPPGIQRPDSLGNLMNTDQRQAVIAFSLGALDFEERVTAGKVVPPVDLYNLLLRLQQLAVDLPMVQPMAQLEPGLPLLSTDADRRDKVAPALGKLGYYHEVSNPRAIYESAETGMGDAVDDLADILGDLQRGRQIHTEYGAQEAAWTWRLDFEIHWRAHAVALMAVLEPGLGSWILRAASQDSGHA